MLKKTGKADYTASLAETSAPSNSRELRSVWYIHLWIHLSTLLAQMVHRHLHNRLFVFAGAGSGLYNADGSFPRNIPYTHGIPFPLGHQIGAEHSAGNMVSAESSGVTPLR